MIDRLLLAAGLAFAKRRVRHAVRRVFYTVAAFAVLLLAALVAAGFLTAAGFVYLLEAVGVTEACVIMAALYAFAGIFGFLIFRLAQARRSRFAPVSAIEALQPAAASTKADERLPGGIIAVGVLLALGYIAGRSLSTRR